jgi:hypothetical protein
MSDKENWTPPQLTSKDLKKLLARHREAAQTLKARKKYRMVTYHLGYVLEFALKACVCKHLRQITYPTGYQGFFKTHSFPRLYMLSGLQDLFDRGKSHATLYDGFVQEFLLFGDDWTNMRYDPEATKRLSDARVAKRLYNTLIGHGRSASKSVLGVIEQNKKW